MPSTLEAVQESIIYQWDGEELLQILFENPEAIRSLLRCQVKLIRKRRDTISDLAFQLVKNRLVKLLLEHGHASETSAQRDLPLTRSRQEWLPLPKWRCRTLYQLQRDGLLQVTRASITMHDRAALFRLVKAE